MTTKLRSIRKFFGAQQGMATAEFALVLPMLLLMFYGAVEVTRYILVVQKVEKLTHTIADVTSQSRTLTTASLDQLTTASADIMRPFAVGANTRILVSSLYRNATDANARVNWRYSGGGSMTATSAIGALGTTPVMPGPGFTFNARENVICAEVFYRLSPLVSNEFFGSVVIYRAAFYKPRLAALTNAPT